MTTQPRRRWSYHLRTLFALTAGVAIWIGSGLAVWNGLVGMRIEPMPRGLILLMPFWMPIVFAGYAVGTRTVTWKMLVIFAIVQLAVTAWSCWLSNSPPREFELNY